GGQGGAGGGVGGGPFLRQARRRRLAPHPRPLPAARCARGGRGGVRGVSLARRLISARCSVRHRSCGIFGWTNFGAAEHLPACDRRLAGGGGSHPPAASLVTAARRQIHGTI